MSASTEIDSTLQQMTRLLRDSGCDSWADVFDALRNELTTDTSHAVWQISRLFGGTGSLNDLVLHRNGQALFNENNELHELRSRLHAQCMQSRWID